MQIFGLNFKNVEKVKGGPTDRQTDGPMNRPMDGPTNRETYRVLCMQLKRLKRMPILQWQNSFVLKFILIYTYKRFMQQNIL